MYGRTLLRAYGLKRHVDVVEDDDDDDDDILVLAVVEGNRVMGSLQGPIYCSQNLR